MTRLFVAAWPDDATVERLVALQGVEEPGVRRVPRRNLHVTLRFLGDVDQGVATDLLHTASFSETVAGLGPAVQHLGGRQLVVPISGVDRLAAEVRRATAPIGAPDAHTFRGHVTIARTQRDAGSSLPGTEIAGHFRIDSVALVASELLPTGAVYTTVATFPTSPSRGGRGADQQ